MESTELTLVDINTLSDVPVTKELVASDEFAKKYAYLLALTEQLAQVKATVDAGIKEIVKENYLETGESSITSSGYRYTYVPETTRETFNTKALKADNPDLYKEYVKVSNVSASLRVTKMEKKDD